MTLGENPAGSKAWSQPEIIDAFEGLGEATADLCQYGLQHPENQMALRKRTKFMGQEEALVHLHRKCPGDHEHAPIEGSVKVGERTVALSEWSGGYTLPLCQAILAGAEQCLQSEPREAYHTGVMPEEILMEGEELVESDPEENFEEPEMIPEGDLEEELDEHLERDAEHPSRKEDDYNEGLDAPRLPAAPDHRRFPIASETCKAVEQAHRQLGHPSRKTLVRMLRLSGATDGAVEHAKTWRCDVCALRAAPKHPTAAAAGVRPYGFNQQHQVDLKYVRDSRGRKYVFLSMLDVGTAFHQGVLLKTRRAEYVASKWLRHFVEPFGIPKRLIHDQGGEFEAGFTAMLEDLSLPTTVTGAHSGWQLSLGERHGGLLGLILETIVVEHQAVGYSDMKRVLSAGVAAKNGTISRDGYTPNQRLFGTDVHFPGLTEEEERPSFAEGLGTEGEVACAHKMRLTARVALLRQDVQDKLRRSMLRKPTRGKGPFVPGSQIYYWVPRKAQRRYVPGIWRGPATVLVRESHKRYFVSWRGRCLLLSEENMRWATGEELALQSPVPHQDLQDLSRRLKDPEGHRGFEDGSQAAAPPEQPKPHLTAARQVWRDRGKAMMKGLRSAKRLLKDVPAAFKRPAKKVRMLTDKQQAALHDAPAAPGARGRRALTAPSPQIPVAPRIPDAELPPVPSSPIADAVDEENDRLEAQELPQILDEELRTIAGPERRRALLDDVPMSIKRKREHPVLQPQGEADAKRLRTAFVFALVNTAKPEEGALQNEWLSRYELALLRNLTGLDITAARLHRAPRKKMQAPTKMKNRARTSILIGEKPSITFIVEENAAEVARKPKRKTAFFWTGLTMFHRPPEQQIHAFYLEVPKGLMEVKLPTPAASEFRQLWAEEVKDLLVADALVLRLKENKKELDPRFFDAEEKAAFDKSDQKEWSQWLANKVVRFLTPAEAAKVPREKVFRAPMRVVRTNRAAERLAPLVAKSRLIIPGHLDPEIGTYRTDSPTAATMTTRLLKLMAASRGYQVYSFDVSTAFLSGKATSREIYVRAPPGGLPAVDGYRAIAPLELMQVLKSAYGLTESPRLWYLEAKDGMSSTGLKELAASRSVFVAAEKGKTWAACALHVDDGLLVGDDNDKRFVELRAKINQRFNIKEWHHLTAEKSLSFLGVDLHLEQDGFTDRMDKYIQGIEAPEAPKASPTTALTPEEVSQYRRLVMKMRWPAQHCMPQMLYSVSKLAQQVTKATVQDFKEALSVLKTMRQEAEKDELAYGTARSRSRRWLYTATLMQAWERRILESHNWLPSTSLHQQNGPWVQLLQVWWNLPPTRAHGW